MSDQNSEAGTVFKQYVAGLTAAFGAFAMGNVLGWTSPAQMPLEGGEYGFPVSDDEFSWIGSTMNLGAAVVCIPIGFMISHIGRKPSMLLMVIPFLIGWALLIWAKNVIMMYVARFILGIAGGAFCVAAPVYIGEIAEKDIRGRLGSCFQLMVTCGILFAYAIGAGLKVFAMSIVCGIIPIIFGIAFAFMPETPTYLISKNKIDSGIKAMQWLRGKNYDYAAELEDVKQAEEQLRSQQVSIGAAMLRPPTLTALAISMSLMLFQQMCGINAVIFYSTDIFEAAETGIDAKVSTITIGVMQVVATFFAVMVVDKLGRRILLLLSGALMAVSTIGMGVYFYLKDGKSESIDSLTWLPLVSLCLFIIMFSFGFGPVPWLMLGELFATDVKGVAGSIVGTFNWVLAFIVTKTFVNMKETLGTGPTFWLFAIITLIGVAFVALFVPETKGKTLNEIQGILGKNRLNRN